MFVPLQPFNGRVAPGTAGLWAWHLCHLQPSLGSTWLGASLCPTLLLSIPPPMASPEPPPARSRGTEQGIDFATFPMFFILHPTRHHACPLSPPLQPHALTASCPQRVSWCSSPLASSSTRVSLKLLTGVEENRRGRSPSGFPSL